MSFVAPSSEPAVKSLLDIDPYLEPFKNILVSRYESFINAYNHIDNNVEGGWQEFSVSYKKFGVILEPDKSVTIKEWVCSAKEVYLTGDFNNWNKLSHPLVPDKYGVWSCCIPATKNGFGKKECAIKHDSIIKLRIISKDGHELYRNSPWSRYVKPNAENIYEHHFLHDQEYKFKYSWPLKEMPLSERKSLRIYEAHIGIATEEYAVGSYNNFRENVVPYIVELGYNAVQLMAVMEHAYYASFGYQVTNFFAVSSRYGTPSELKSLIDELHKHKIVVLLDIVHSHACKNSVDGLNQFDGTNAAYFHDNNRGHHTLWDSRLFDYTSFEVRRFLLSNLRYFIEEFHFDGFRFDGVTSMLYNSHGIGHGFSGDYNEYFNMNVDVDSLLHLQLANYMLHSLYPNIITIAEDVSGMPATCLPVSMCGLGFDYRLSMAIPDMWIKVLKESKDEDWDVGNIVWTHKNRRHLEKHIAYCESHDQALVGDKTIAFWLMDKEMYYNMSCIYEKSFITERGLALHKMIRLLTCALGGEGYLNFIGNEFGHPEWLDFPREGNGSSFKYARRQWSLVHCEHLRYQYFFNFDRDMNKLEDKYCWLSSHQAYISTENQSDKVIVFERGGLLWIFNFHPVFSFTDYRVGVHVQGTYKVVLNTDDSKYDGEQRVDYSSRYFTEDYKFHNRDYSFMVFIPARTALVFGKE